MVRRRIVIETPGGSAFAQKLRDFFTLARLGMGALRVRSFIQAKPVMSTFLGLGTGFILARALSPRR